MLAEIGHMTRRNTNLFRNRHFHYRNLLPSSYGVNGDEQRHLRFGHYSIFSHL